MRTDRSRPWLRLALSVVIASCIQPIPDSESPAPEEVGGLTQLPLPRSGYVYDVAVTEGAAWVTSRAGLFRVDAVTRKIVNVLPRDYLFRTTPGHGELWIATGSLGRVLRFDPRNRALSAEIDIGAGPVTHLAMSDDAVWASAVRDLVGIDPVTNEVVARLRSPATFGDMTFGAGALWVIVGANQEGAVWRIDPATAEVQEKIPLPNPSFWNEIEAGAGAVWVTSSRVTERKGDPIGVLYRIDPSTDDISADVPLGERTRGPGGARAISPITLAVAEDSVWVLLDHEHFVVKVDPGDLGAQETLGGIRGASSDVGSEMTIGAAALWITAPGAVTWFDL